jgi:hypothetical protein
VVRLQVAVAVAVVAVAVAVAAHWRTEEPNSHYHHRLRPGSGTAWQASRMCTQRNQRRASSRQVLL